MNQNHAVREWIGPHPDDLWPKDYNHKNDQTRIRDCYTFDIYSLEKAFDLVVVDVINVEWAQGDLL